MKKGMLIVLSGPSGVGKGTILAHMDLDRLNTYVNRSWTTRNPREGEVPGVTYDYVTKEEFQKAVEEGNFLEYNAKYVNNSYGSPKKIVEEKRNQGTNVILEIDVNGYHQVKEKCPDAIGIFMTPPDMEELEQRIINRKKDAPEDIARRLERARDEMKCKDEYDYIVLNDDIDRCAAEMTEILEKEQKRLESEK